MPLTCAVWCDISVRMGDGSMQGPVIWLLEILPVAMVSRNESRSMEDAMSKNAMKQAALTAALLLASCASAAPGQLRGKHDSTRIGISAGKNPVWLAGTDLLQ